MAWRFKKMMRMEFVPLMKCLIDLYEPDVYVEVGVQNGETFNQISPLVKEAHAVDIVPMLNVIDLPNVTIHCMSSLDFAKEWSTPIDLLLIDADHSKEAVLADFTTLSSLITPGTGLILMHDTYPGQEYLLKPGWCHDAWETARKIHLCYDRQTFVNWEILTLPGPWAGVSILRNAKKHLHWMKD